MCYCARHYTCRPTDFKLFFFLLVVSSKTHAYWTAKKKLVYILLKRGRPQLYNTLSKNM
jgi:hypothetical protein